QGAVIGEIPLRLFRGQVLPMGYLAVHVDKDVVVARIGKPFRKRVAGSATLALVEWFFVLRGVDRKSGRILEFDPDLVSKIGAVEFPEVAGLPVQCEGMIGINQPGIDLDVSNDQIDAEALRLGTQPAGQTRRAI